MGNSALGELARAAQEATLPPARLLTDDDRRAVEAEIYDAARLTPAYGFMLFSACGIAALGLLQSSVAVIIGAMLISPLMGPIMAMGMALARLEPRSFKTAAVTLAIGAVLSVLASTIIVFVSPLKDVTPEILGRTRPTLLDLIIALLSGFVGAYLTVNRKGGAIAGVAIATALMPPLAVVGYGLATATWQIAGGALLLFMTNVVAILAAVYGVARRYGFRPAARQGAAWETPALLAVTFVLCIPLAVSLRGIVVEARETARVRAAIGEAFDGVAPHITELTVDTASGLTAVQCVVVTRRYVPGAAEAVARRLDAGAKVEIEQIVTDTGAPVAAAGGALSNRIAAPAPAASSPEQRLRAMLSGVGRVEAVETREGVLQAIVVLNDGATLSDYLATEQAAQRFLPAAVRLVPPLTPLPEVKFAAGSTDLAPDAARSLEVVAWALKRWSASRVQVTALSAPGQRARKLAEARADAVAVALRARGIVDATLATAETDGPTDAVRVALAPAT